MNAKTRVLKSKPNYGWHLTGRNRQLEYGDGRKIEDGVVFHHDGGVSLCESGFHYSASLSGASRYRTSTVVSRVRAWGWTERDDDTSVDKLVSSSREHLWVLDITDVLLDFAYEKIVHLAARLWSDDREFEKVCRNIQRLRTEYNIPLMRRTDKAIARMNHRNMTGSRFSVELGFNASRAMSELVEIFYRAGAAVKYPKTATPLPAIYEIMIMTSTPEEVFEQYWPYLETEALSKTAIFTVKYADTSRRFHEHSAEFERRVIGFASRKRREARRASNKE